MAKTEKELLFLSLNDDLMFKHIFGSEKRKKYTAEFISEILSLTGNEFKGAKITNSVTLDRNTVLKKKFEVDVVVETTEGKIYNLEMQNKHNKYSEIKNTMYVMKLFSGQLKIGENYDKTNPITQICIVNGNTLVKRNVLVDKYGIISFYEPENVILNDFFRVFVVDLKCQIDYTKTSRKLIGWLRLLKAKNIEEARETIKWNESLREVVDEMSEFIKKDYVQTYAESERLLRSNIELWKKESLDKGISQGLLEGMEIGMQEGLKKEKINIAKNLLIDPEISIDKIAKYTGLTKGEILALKEDNMNYNN